MAWTYSTTRLTLSDSYGVLLGAIPSAKVPSGYIPSVNAGPNQGTIAKFKQIDYSRTVNETGILTITILGFMDPQVLMEDARIGVWRVYRDTATNYERSYLDCETVWLLAKWAYDYDDHGQATTLIMAESANQLLERRIVAYTEGTPVSGLASDPGERRKVVAADDMCKLYVQDNMITIGSIGPGAPASVDNGPNRSWSAYISLQPNLTQAPPLTKYAAWGNLKRVLQEIAQASEIAATPLFFDIFCQDPSQMEFRTYITQRGSDRTGTSGHPITFSPENRNLAKGHYEVDYTKTYSFVYGGGRGEGRLKVLTTSYDTARITNSAFGRREGYVADKNAITTTELQNVSDKELRVKRPAKRFSGQILSIPGSAYGIDWFWGDRVMAGVLTGKTVPCRIDTVHVSINERGAESIQCYVKSEV